jgi:beta-lactamase regulating signal transducer with metallopeptidase domain
MRTVPVIVIAFLNSLWQSGILAGLVWLALKFARRINAATRYIVWWIVLAAALVLPIAPRIERQWRGRAQPAPVVAPGPTGIRYLKTPVLVAPDAIATVREEPSARWPLLILGAWAALLLYRLGQTGKSYLHLRGIKRRARASALPLPAAPGSVRLLLSADIESPIAVGFLRPAIVLPASLPAQLSQAEMDHVLLHEAAHLARWDDWTNLAARLLGAVLALDPVALWILSRIARERAMACDDWAVARIGAARPYAESLAHLRVAIGA